MLHIHLKYVQIQPGGILKSTGTSRCLFYVQSTFQKMNDMFQDQNVWGKKYIIIFFQSGRKKRFL